MKRIITSMLTIVAAVALVAGGTGAFFGDTERSSGNTFAAGTLDLKVDNESYYNGNKCANVSTDPGVEQWEWVGESPYPVPGTPCTTSWYLDDLANGRLFFDFNDVKPGDEGEDTISLHVQNDAWACMDLTVTSNDDNGSTEPELLVEEEEADDVADEWDGELAQAIQMVWWADDGDNVLEDGERIMSGDVKTLLDLGYTSGPFSVVLADSTENAWTGQASGPLTAGDVHYVAKAWCVGELTLDPVPAGQGVNPSVATGILCNGQAVGNEIQTDTTTLDIQFRAMQARHNAQFICSGPRTTLTVVKEVVGGDVSPADFQMTLDGDPVPQNVQLPVSPGSYTVGEMFTVPDGYTMETSFSGVCEGAQTPQVGTATVVEGQNNVCTVTNTFRPIDTTLEVVKVVAGDAPDGVTSASFQLTLNGANIDQNTPQSIDPNGGPYTVGEVYAVPNGYTMETTFSGACGTDGAVTLTPFTNNVCTVTNTFTAIPATLTVNKVVINNNGGNNVPTDFQLQVIGGGVTNVSSGASNQFPSGNYTVTEVGVPGYVASWSGDCVNGGGITLAPGDNKTCTITNTDLPAAITLIKNVVDGTASPSQFVMRIDGNPVPQSTSVAVDSNTDHTISEDLAAGYTFTSITGAGCPAGLNVPFQLDEGQSITCTITNTFTGS